MPYFNKVVSSDDYETLNSTTDEVEQEKWRSIELILMLWTILKTLGNGIFLLKKLYTALRFTVDQLLSFNEIEAKSRGEYLVGSTNRFWLKLGSNHDDDGNKNPTNLHI